MEAVIGLRFGQLSAAADATTGGRFTLKVSARRPAIGHGVVDEPASDEQTMYSPGSDGHV